MAPWPLGLSKLEAEALDAQRSAQRLAEEHAAAAVALQARLERQARGAPPRESEQLQQLRAMVCLSELLQRALHPSLKYTASCL